MSPLELLPELCEGCSESNASYFIMLAHVRGGCWWCGSRDWTFPPNIPLDAAAVWQMAAEGQSDKLASDMEVYINEGCLIESLHTGKMAPTDIHQCLLNISGDQIVDVSTVRWLLVCFKWNSSGNIELWRLFPIKIKFHTTVQYPYFNNQVLKFLHIGNN